MPPERGRGPRSHLNFYSTPRSSRMQSNSFKTKDGSPFYPSQSVVLSASRKLPLAINSMSDSREKIVIVDADPVGRDALLTAAQSAGYDVSAFATAHEGLDAVRQTSADLLLL